jgi:Flp pilus assembly protein TadG
MKKQAGSTTVEFALSMLGFIMIILGIFEVSRLAFFWNTANEATRSGARYAVVCADPSSNTRILAAMQGIMPQVQTINVAWEPAGCDQKSCEGVTVSITGMSFRFMAPLPQYLTDPVIMMPGFSTYLPREMMQYNPLIC